MLENAKAKSIFKNYVNMCGCIADDVVLKTASNKTKYCHFDIAIERGTKNKVKDFIPVRIFGDSLATEFASRCKKGGFVEIVGEWHNNTDKNDSKKKYAVINCLGFCPIIVEQTEEIQTAFENSQMS